MYLRPRFLEELHAIREEMSRECDYDMDLFAETVRRNLPVNLINTKTIPAHPLPFEPLSKEQKLKKKK